jgi:hypothetical protein
VLVSGPARAYGSPVPRCRALLPVLACGLLAGCASGPPPPPTYHLLPRPVRHDEVALSDGTATQGKTRLTPLGLTALDEIVGSHAEFEPKGKYVRVRVLVENTDRSSVGFDPAHQQLVTSDGVVHDPDPQAMLIERQPARQDLGSFVRLEFDLYYDVPVPVTARALRLHGGTTLADDTDAGYTEIALRH